MSSKKLLRKPILNSLKPDTATWIYCKMARFLFESKLPLQIRRRTLETAIYFANRKDTTAKAQFTKPRSSDFPVPHVKLELKKKPLGTVIYVHGGGFIAGSAKSYLPLASKIASYSQCNLVLPDYRLAPEHPYPAAIDDVLAIYRMVLSNTRPEDIFLVGDSAGASIISSLMNRVSTLELDAPASITLISPLLDLECKGKSWESNQSADKVLNKSTVLSCTQKYLKGSNSLDPLTSPIDEPNIPLQGFPPTKILVGSKEGLLSDSTNFFKRLKLAGCDTQLEVWPGMQHAWPLMGDRIPESKEAIQNISAFIQENSRVSTDTQDSDLEIEVAG